jgi:hypothetical protein
MLLTLSLAYGLAYLVAGPYFDRRGREWAFYQAVGRVLNPAEALVLLYDPEDHFYPAVGESLPHDLGVRLFYLERPALVRVGVSSLDQKAPTSAGCVYSVIARDSEQTLLQKLGQVETVMHGPTNRADRSFALFRIHRRGTDQVAAGHTQEESTAR